MHIIICPPFNNAAAEPYFFCGDYLAHPHAGGACASGKRVAEQIGARYSQS